MNRLIASADTRNPKFEYPESCPWFISVPRLFFHKVAVPVGTLVSLGLHGVEFWLPKHRPSWQWPDFGEWQLLSNSNRQRGRKDFIRVRICVRAEARKFIILHTIGIPRLLTEVWVVLACFQALVVVRLGGLSEK